MSRRVRVLLPCAIAVLALVATVIVVVTRDEPRQAAERSGGWLVTVYYTAVESHYTGAKVAVRGCPELDCTRGDDPLGRYPKGFVRAVRDEGTGRIVTGARAGEYLNWSYDVGYWLDTAPRDSHGRKLQPYVSAAADPDVLPKGRQLRIRNCGTEDDGSAIPADVCERMRAARWQIRDEFTPGLGGEKHVDVYLGEATGLDFTSNPRYTTLNGATLDVLTPKGS